MNREQFDYVILAIPELNIRKWFDYDIEYLFKNLYWLALRPIEGIKLKKEDFNFNEKQVYLGKTKTNPQDYAVIPSMYLQELYRYIDKKDPGQLLDKLTYDTFYRWLVKLGKILDIPAWTTPQSETREKTKGHIFRKSLGKDMMQGSLGKKYPIDIISRQLRHSKPSITIDHYLKASGEAVKEAWYSV